MPKRKRTSTKKFQRRVRRKVTSRKKSSAYRTRAKPSRRYFRGGGSIDRMALTLFPQKKTVRLFYNDTVSMDPPSTGMTTVQYRSNDLYDPQMAVGGHQPFGFDQLAEFYRKFTVLSSKIRIQVLPSNSLANTGSLFVGIVNNARNEVTSNTVSDLIERGNCIYRLHNFASDANSRPLNLTQYFSLRKSRSVSDPLDEPRFACSDSASPASPTVFEIKVGPVENTVDHPPVLVNISIEYYVVCSTPITQPTS